MKRSFWVNVLVLGVVLSGSACLVPREGTLLEPAANSEYLDPNGDFTLYVSNQSFAKPILDIKVEIDGDVVVHRYFHVRNQHNWTPFTLSLPEGKHVLKASSERGDARIEQEFTVHGEHWAVLNYWYTPDAGTAARNRRFTFSISDEPVYFM